MATSDIMLAKCENLDVEEASAKEDFIFLDVRSPPEREEIRIKNSISMPLDRLPYKLNTLDKNKKYLVYCRSGNKSRFACKLMRQNGFKKVANMEGGIIEWVRKGFGVETAP